MRITQFVAVTAAALTFVSAANAGSVGNAEEEKQVTVAPAGGSGNIALPLLGVALLCAVACGGSSSSTPGTPMTTLN